MPGPLDHQQQHLSPPPLLSGLQMGGGRLAPATHQSRPPNAAVLLTGLHFHTGRFLVPAALGFR